MIVRVEACVDSRVAAREAGSAGADRLELCADLAKEGTTPDRETIATTLADSALPLHVMIRARPGDFHYAGDELEQMRRDIAAVRALGIAGVVLGTLDERGAIDTLALERLVEAARPMAVTFHRAFDRVADPLAALDVLMELGIERVLTAGHAGSAEAGIPMLAELVQRSAGRSEILAGGGIRQHNVRRIVRETGVREVHLRAGPGAVWLRGVRAALAEP
jgi:copper homeostasis protein